MNDFFLNSLQKSRKALFWVAELTE